MIFSSLPYQLYLSFAKRGGRCFKPKRMDFCCQSGFHGIVSKNARARPQPVSAWPVRELAFEHSCSMIRHVVWFDHEVLPMSSASMTSARMTSRDECVARDCVDPLRNFRD